MNSKLLFNFLAVLLFQLLISILHRIHLDYLQLFHKIGFYQHPHIPGCFLKSKPSPSTFYLLAKIDSYNA